MNTCFPCGTNLLKYICILIFQAIYYIQFLIQMKENSFPLQEVCENPVFTQDGATIFDLDQGDLGKFAELRRIQNCSD